MSDIRTIRPAPNPNTVPIQAPLADLNSLLVVCQQLKQTVDSLAGQRGQSTDRAVTFNDLVSLGLISKESIKSSQVVSPPWGASDKTLQDNLDAEAAARVAADATLQTNIDNEAATRLANDNTLQTNINTEATTRATADTTLQTNITNEASTRAAADALLAPLASPTFTGDPKAPTPTAGDNDTSIATTAFVNSAISSATGAYLPLTGGTVTGPTVISTTTAAFPFTVRNTDAVTFSRIRLENMAAGSTSNKAYYDLALTTTGSGATQRTAGQVVSAFTTTNDATRTSYLQFIVANNGSLGSALDLAAAGSNLWTSLGIIGDLTVTGKFGIGITTPRSELDTALGVMTGAANDYIKAQFTMSGGGTITWAGPGGKLKWTARFICIPNAYPTFSAGYVDIPQPTTNIPAINCYDGVARTADVNGVVLNAWEALYAAHAPGTGTSIANFYIVRYTTSFYAPSNWLLIAAVNGDDGKCKLGTGQII